jgi:hypothetical protein
LLATLIDQRAIAGWPARTRRLATVRAPLAAATTWSAIICAVAADSVQPR